MLEEDCATVKAYTPYSMKSFTNTSVPVALEKFMGEKGPTGVVFIRRPSLLDPPLKQICNKVDVTQGLCDCHKTARNIALRTAASLLLLVKNKYGYSPHTLPFPFVFSTRMAPCRLSCLEVL
jgi:hypothetical protein